MKSRLIKFEHVGGGEGGGQNTVQKGGMGSGLCKRGWAGALYGGGAGPRKVRSCTMRFMFNKFKDIQGWAGVLYSEVQVEQV